LAVYDEEIFVPAGLHIQVAHPPAVSGQFEGGGFWFPAIEGAGDAHMLCLWPDQLQLNAINPGCGRGGWGRRLNGLCGLHGTRRRGRLGSA